MARDLERIDRMIDKLRELWHAAPDQRLTQLLHNISSYDGRKDIFYVEDDLTEARMDEMLDRDPTCVHPGTMRGQVCSVCGIRV